MIHFTYLFEMGNAKLNKQFLTSSRLWKISQWFYWTSNNWVLIDTPNVHIYILYYNIFLIRGTQKCFWFLKRCINLSQIWDGKQKWKLWRTNAVKNCIKRYILHDIPLSCKDIIHAKVLYSYSSGTYNYMYYFSI